MKEERNGSNIRKERGKKVFVFNEGMKERMKDRLVRRKEEN